MISKIYQRIHTILVNLKELSYRDIPINYYKILIFTFLCPKIDHMNHYCFCELVKNLNQLFGCHEISKILFYIDPSFDMERQSPAIA